MTFNQSAALAEGWGLFEDAERGLEIQKYDESARFSSDEEARRHVNQQAQLGNENCLAALNAIKANQ